MKTEDLSEPERWQQSFLGPLDGIFASILTCESCSSQVHFSSYEHFLLDLTNCCISRNILICTSACSICGIFINSLQFLYHITRNCTLFSHCLFRSNYNYLASYFAIILCIICMCSNCSFFLIIILLLICRSHSILNLFTVCLFHQC